jgi:hypothetical protein
LGKEGGGILTGKHEGMKTGRRQGKFLDGINMIKRIGGRRKHAPLKSF